MSRQHTVHILGYHGCDAAIGARVLSGDAMLPSERAHDWLGRGVYFWESDPQRALEWAEDKVRSGSFERPYVLGALIDLGNCLDLTTRENHEFLRIAYQGLVKDASKSGYPMPENKDASSDANSDKLLRFLDCAVINYLHAMIAEGEQFEPFQTVRGLFVEGAEVYPGARFKNKTHTQIAVVDPSCIKAVFLPR